MLYTYEVFINNVRKSTDTVFDKAQYELTRQLKLYPNATWRLEITDNITRVTSCFYDEDAISEWQEAAARSYTWSDAATKASKVKILEERVAMGWAPFDNKETDIVMKHEEPIDNNVKTLAALAKPRTSAVPPKAILALGEAMQDGANKYGQYNWRTTSVSATVFYDAMMRHLLAWYDGEDLAADSGKPHLAHLMANCAILLDAKEHNVFNDNRNAKSKEIIK